MSEPASTELPDLTRLAMFQSSTPGTIRRPGRIRSSFSLAGTIPDEAAPQPVPIPVPQARRVVDDRHLTVAKPVMPPLPLDPLRPMSPLPSARTDPPRATPSPAPARPEPPRPKLPTVDGDDIDWALVSRLREQASALLTARLGEIGEERGSEVAVGRRAAATDRELREQEGWAVIRRVLDDERDAALGRSAITWTPHERALLEKAVFDAVFGLGRLQPLVDDERVENIMVSGFDRVLVEYADGHIEEKPPVAESDDDLVRFLQTLAGEADPQRTFSQASPSLHMTLPGGARLAAALDTSALSVVIRRHRVRRLTLNDLVRMGSLSPVAADFLGAAVRAKKSIVVSGGMGDGKTTFLRALCTEFDPAEVIGTFETERELFLREDRDHHRIVYEWETRTGSGEVTPGGTPAGLRTIVQQIIDSFRFNLSRQIVGEVRGPEVWSMIKVMESGAGSLSTTHGKSARLALEKLISCAVESGNATWDLASQKLGSTLDLVVQLTRDIVPDPDHPGRTIMRRYVHEIRSVAPGEQMRIADTVIFRHVPGRCAVATTRPDELAADLVTAGWDEAAFSQEMMLNGGAR